jgi:bifunctional DNA-binding transcriptional regulator/antitoxin component of YhaV-PrlF toxin-antitoxin module
MDRQFETTVVDDEGHIDIPADMRERHGLTKGARVRIAEEGSRLVVESAEPQKKRKNITELTGILGPNSKALDILMEERRKDREAEDRSLRS